jgi:hypothetical protein
MLDTLEWTEERIALLRRMHRDGCSFSEIGDALGVSKNACIGKAGRLGLEKRRVGARSGSRKPKDPRGKPEKVAHKTVLRVVRAGYGSGLRIASSVSADLPIFTCVDPDSLNKSLDDLGAHECKYIAGDPRDGALYCGHPIFERSYCQAHFERCYVEPQKRWSDAA